MSGVWKAPKAEGPVRAVVSVPGSKSMMNRALVLAALADSPSRIDNALVSRDTELMTAALGSLGAEFDSGAEYVRLTAGLDALEDQVRVRPGALAGPAKVECGLAGTVMRFVPPVAALADGVIGFDGDPGARVRPMGVVLGALRDLGARVEGDRLPFSVHGTGRLRGGEVTVDASASSQFVSGLLLAAARFDRGVTVRHVGSPLPSLPHVRMTVAMLRERGVVVDDSQQDTWRVEPGVIAPLDVRVEPDLSNATPFLAAAAVTGGQVTIPGWPSVTTQAGDAIRDILERMGAVVELSERGLAVTGPDELTGIDVDLREVGELTPTVAAMSSVASTSSRLRGIAHLRGHETDRLAALESEIDGLGGRIEQTEDGLIIEPARLHGGAWHAYADHRMATAGAILGLVVDGIEVDDIATTSKTIPDFAGMWQRMLGGP